MKKFIFLFLFFVSFSRIEHNSSSIYAIYLGSPLQPKFEDVIMTPALNHFIAGIVLHVVQFVCHEQILGWHLIAANQQTLENKEANAWRRRDGDSLVCCCSVFQFFQLILQDTMSIRFELCLRNFLIDRREKEQTWETGPGRYENSCAGRGKLRDIEFTKWRMVSCHPTGRHCTSWFCDFVLVECPRKSNVLSFNIVSFLSLFFHVIKKNCSEKDFVFIVTNRKIKKITLKNVHEFKKLSKVYCLSQH